MGNLSEELRGDCEAASPKEKGVKISCIGVRKENSVQGGQP